jgi:hypothetical protein
MFLESFDDELCKLAISAKLISRVAKSVAAPKDVVKKRWFGGTKVVKGTTPGISSKRVDNVVDRSRSRSAKLESRFGSVRSDLARMDRGKPGRTGRTREQLTADKERIQRQFGKERQLRRDVPLQHQYTKEDLLDPRFDIPAGEEKLTRQLAARRGAFKKPSGRERAEQRRQLRLERKMGY